MILGKWSVRRRCSLSRVTIRRGSDTRHYMVSYELLSPVQEYPKLSVWTGRTTLQEDVIIKIYTCEDVSVAGALISKLVTMGQVEDVRNSKYRDIKIEPAGEQAKYNVKVVVNRLRDSLKEDIERRAGRQEVYDVQQVQRLVLQVGSALIAAKAQVRSNAERPARRRQTDERVREQRFGGFPAGRLRE